MSKSSFRGLKIAGFWHHICNRLDKEDDRHSILQSRTSSYAGQKRLPKETMNKCHCFADGF